MLRIIFLVLSSYRTLFGAVWVKTTEIITILVVLVRTQIMLLFSLYYFISLWNHIGHRAVCYQKTNLKTIPFDALYSSLKTNLQVTDPWKMTSTVVYSSFIKVITMFTILFTFLHKVLRRLSFPWRKMLEPKCTPNTAGSKESWNLVMVKAQNWR